MIDFTDALSVANRHLQTSEIPVEIVEYKEFSCGWVFFYQSSEYLKSGSLSDMLAGNSPFIVDRQDGSLHVLGTAYPTEKYIEEYENSRARDLDN